MNRDAYLVHTYRRLRQEVILAGYAQELLYVDERRYEGLTPEAFLVELAYVILNTGMSNAVVERRWNAFADAWGWWEQWESMDVRACEAKALAVFGNRRKVEAIGQGVRVLRREGWDAVDQGIRSNGALYLQRFPFIGPVTCFHLGRNLGLDVVKPDRHLMRMATAACYDTPYQMCRVIADRTKHRLGTVDVVLWRYAASVDSDYVTSFERIGKDAEAL